MLSPQPSHYWCGYGLQDPTENKKLEFTVQINPPRLPSSRRTGGSFFKDEGGRVCLCHNGILTKGHASLGKDRFIAEYDGDLGEAEWPDGRTSTFVLVARIDENELLKKIAQFVNDVQRFKRFRSVSETAPRDLQKALSTPELAGSKQPYRVKHKVAPVNLHGFVFRALKTALGSYGDVSRTALIDLFLTKRGRATHLFEIKTDTTRSSVYAGVGQLMFHGAIGGRVNRVLVLPGEPSRDTKERLQRLGITVLQYAWRGQEPTFLNLRDLVS